MRFANRQPLALLSQLPPRITRSEPDAGPCGSVTGSAAYSSYHQSCTHSDTLPSMSYNPHASGCSFPTGCVVFFALPPNQAYLPNWLLLSPKLYAVVKPARRGRCRDQYRSDCRVPCRYATSAKPRPSETSATTYLCITKIASS